jgi:hypothetical protein
MNKELKDFAIGILKTLLTAAIIGQCTMLFHLNERLARVETKLELLAGKTIATNP